jgi:hypothetical protein
MITLLGEELAPVTSSIGFVAVDLERATAALREWRLSLHSRGGVSVHPLAADLTRSVKALEPLTGGGRPRELLLATAAPGWTAYLDCSVAGTDATSAILYLSRALNCRGVFVMAVPHTYGTSLETPGRYGAVQFTMVGPDGEPPLGYLRVVSATHDGSRWVFENDGHVQDFESPERYRARRVRDRFTSDMLTGYCAALGLYPFVAEFYGPAASLVESPFVPPPTAKVLTLEETQRWLGIRPGLADNLPG